MYHRSKSLAIESIVVMFVLILLSFVVFLIVRSGSSAYENILNNKQNTESARVVYSFINMKVKQSDSSSLVSVVSTEYGNTLKIDTADGKYATYIYFTNGVLYECLTKQDMKPEIAASNKITELYGFDISSDGNYINIKCETKSGGSIETSEGTVGLRT